jgi:hypothetical protein
MSRVTAESNTPVTQTVIELVKEILNLKAILDEKGAKPTGRKLEINKTAYDKMSVALNAIQGALGCEIIISSQYPFAKMWGWTE